MYDQVHATSCIVCLPTLTMTIGVKARPQSAYVRNANRHGVLDPLDRIKQHITVLRVVRIFIRHEQDDSEKSVTPLYYDDS